MATAIILQTEGRRVYLLGNTYPVKDQIKSGGGKWDAQRGAWYVGVQRKALAEQLAGKATEGLQQRAQAEREDGISTSARVIKGRAEYQGKTYYVLAVGRSQADGKPYAKLAFRDGSRVFWAHDAGAVKVLKMYEEPTSIDALRAYAQRMQDTRAEFGNEMCAECEERRATTTAADSSGFVAGVCGRCASMSRWERSYC